MVTSQLRAAAGLRVGRSSGANAKLKVNQAPPSAQGPLGELPGQRVTGATFLPEEERHGCVCARVRTCACVCTSTRVRTSARVRVYVRMSTCALDACVHECMHVCMHVGV